MTTSIQVATIFLEDNDNFKLEKSTFLFVNLPSQGILTACNRELVEIDSVYTLLMFLFSKRASLILQTIV